MMEQHSLHIDYSDFFFFWHPVLIFIYYSHILGVVLFSLYLACIFILII